MSVISDITMSPPISVSGVESVLSDTESTRGTGDNGNPATLAPFGLAASKYTGSNKQLAYEVPNLREGFSFEDGDACILAGNTLVATHKYLLKRFKKLGNRITDGILALGPDDHAVEDFRNTFKILYASVIDESFEFDPPILTSALRLATTYEYPALRAFAIKRLEDASLSAVDRIRLAREFGLTSWEEPAYVELCERDEAITTLEANVLGLNAFVHVAKIREKEQRRRGRDIDATIESDDEEIDVEEPQVANDEKNASDPPPSAPANSHVSGAKIKKPLKKRRRSRFTTAEVSTANNGVGESQASHDQAARAMEEEKKNVESSMKPCFIDTSIPETHNIGQRNSSNGLIELPVPDCACTTGPGYSNGYRYLAGLKCTCKLPACAVRAFKDLQTRQVTHANTISKLETAVAQIQNPPTSPVPEAPVETTQPGTIASKSIQEEVRAWLDRCSGQVNRG